jgi:hypothetical protein
VLDLHSCLRLVFPFPYFEALPLPKDFGIRVRRMIIICLDVEGRPFGILGNRDFAKTFHGSSDVQRGRGVYGSGLIDKLPCHVNKRCMQIFCVTLPTLF